MGIVYKAEQRTPIRRVVALKVIKLGMDTREVVARFEVERQALALMDHPGVSKVFEAGTTEQGRPYFAMEYVAGLPLTRFCNESRLTNRDRLELFIHVCQAVQHAHQKAIIHRDLKPTNILVTLVDGKPVPKIIDFGIAKATSQRLTEHTLFTRTGSIVGTPEYMSPEQATTSGYDVDTRTDIYSLGVILYELLTGLLPFDANSLRKGSEEQMIRIIKETEPPRPSTKIGQVAGTPGNTPGTSHLDELARQHRSDPRTIQKELRGDLDWIVMKCLEKDRTRRYETANGLGLELKRFLDGEPIEARSPSTIYRLRKACRRHKVGIAVVATVFTSLLLGLGGATWGLLQARADAHQARDAKGLAEINEKRAQEQEALAHQNAVEAQKNAREAEHQLAKGLVAQGDAFVAVRRWADAKAKYADAAARLSTLGFPARAADFGLCRVLWHAPEPLLSLSLSAGQIGSMAVSPDGLTIYTGHDDGMIRRWESYTGAARGEFSGHRGLVGRLRLSDDGKRLLSTSWGGDIIRLWNTEDGSHKEFSGQGVPSVDAALSHDGKRVVSAGDDGSIWLWDAGSAKQLRVIKRADGRGGPVEFSKDDLTVFKADAFGILEAWDADGGQLLSSVDTHRGAISCLSLSPDGSTLASCGGNPDIQLWNVKTRKPIESRTLKGHQGWVTRVRFSQDGRMLVSGSVDRSSRVWDVDTGRELLALVGHAGEVNDVDFMLGTGAAVTVAKGGALRVWLLDVSKDLLLITPSSHVTAISLTPDSQGIVAGGADGSLSLLDSHTGKALQTFAGNRGQINAVSVSPDGKTAISGGADTLVHVWEMGSGREIRFLEGHKAAVSGAAICPDGHTAISAAGGEPLRHWNLDSGKLIRTFGIQSQWMRQIAVSPDGRSAASGDDGDGAVVWDITTGNREAVLTGHDRPITDAVFSADGRSILTSSWDKTLRRWSPFERSKPTIFGGHTDNVDSVAWASHSELAISGGADGMIKLWDTASGEEIQTLPGTGTHAISVALSADASTGVAAEAGGLVVWHFDHLSHYKQFEPSVSRAIRAFRSGGIDSVAFKDLGEWYGFRGFAPACIYCLEAARRDGLLVDSSLLAESYHSVGRLDDARREFAAAANATSGTNAGPAMRLRRDATDRELALRSIAPRAESLPGLIAEKKYDEAIGVYADYLRLFPEDPTRIAQRAVVYAAMGKFNEAAADYALAAHLNPTNHFLLYRSMCLHLYVGDGAAYSADRRRMLEDFGKTEAFGERTAKAVLLTPCDPDVLRTAAILAERALATAGPANPLAEWINLANGIAEYRADHYDSAIQFLEKTRDAGGWVDSQVHADFMLAMALFKLGRKQAASEAFDLGAQRMRAYYQSTPRPPNELENWLLCHIAHREAAQLLGLPSSALDEPPMKDRAEAVAEERSPSYLATSHLGAPPATRPATRAVAVWRVSTTKPATQAWQTSRPDTGTGDTGPKLIQKVPAGLSLLSEFHFSFRSARDHPNRFWRRLPAGDWEERYDNGTTTRCRVRGYEVDADGCAIVVRKDSNDYELRIPAPRKGAILKLCEVGKLAWRDLLPVPTEIEIVSIEDAEAVQRRLRESSPAN
jgi:WD40 repeat protein